MDINRLVRGLEAFSNWSQVSLPADCDGGRKKRGCENCSALGGGDKKSFILTDLEELLSTGRQKCFIFTDLEDA